jgi:uncharacterized damage-inducible protein DinB
VNATELLDNSHLMVIQALDDLPETEWDIPNVCGEWSIKEIVAHLASYEHALVDALNTFRGAEPTPYIINLLQNGTAFNAQEVEKRRYDTAQHILDEYNDTQVQTTSMLAQIPAEKVSQVGTMPWYHKDRSLDDLITMLYNHTREHCMQITAFRVKRNI